MKIYTKLIRIFSLLLVALALIACGSTVTQDTWKAENYFKKSTKILVIGIEKDEEIRRLFEDSMVSQLKKRNVEATASLDLLEPNTEITRETVKPVIEGKGYNSALITHLVAMDDVDRYVPTRRTTPDANYFYNNMYGYYSKASPVIHTQEVAVKEKIAVLETALFDIETEERVWKMTSQTFNPRRSKSTVNDIVYTIVTNMRIAELI